MQIHHTIMHKGMPPKVVGGPSLELLQTALRLKNYTIVSQHQLK